LTITATRLLTTAVSGLSSAGDHILNLARPPGFVSHVGVIQIRSHLVLVDPPQLAVHQGFMRVVAHAFVAQQFDGPLDP